jgi:hypothetical protein
MSKPPTACVQLLLQVFCMIITTLMARTAAYTGKKVTWDMMLNSKEALAPEKITFNMKFPPRAVRHPGRDEVIASHGWAYSSKAPKFTMQQMTTYGTAITVQEE